jgi:hypothetical protein
MEANIYQRINNVMKEVAYVQKDKAVSGGGQNYKAVTHDQVISVCRKHIVAHGILITPEQLKGEIIIKRDVAAEVKMHLYSGEYAVHFINIDKPEDRISVTVNAHAADNGDKAPGKCMTYAVKMAILKVLCLETGEDDESRTAEEVIPDVTDAITAIKATTSMEALQGAFKNAWNAYTHKENRAEITKAKDAKKKELAEVVSNG